MQKLKLKNSNLKGFNHKYRHSNYNKLHIESFSRFTIMFSTRCTFLCSHCYNWKLPDNYNELCLKEWNNVLENISHIANSDAELVIGGDGMAELDYKLIKILKKSNELGLKTLLNTNGFLINKIILNRLHNEGGLKKISISLDFLDSKKQNKQRGINKSYEHIQKLIETIRESKMNIQVTFNCIFMKPNLDQILPLAKWNRELNINSNINFQAIMQPFNSAYIKNWYELSRFKEMWPGNEQKTYKIIDELIQLKKKGYNIGNTIKQLQIFKEYFRNSRLDKIKGCNFKEVGLTIDSNGHAKLCPYMNPFTHVKNKSLNDSILTDNHIKTINNMFECKDHCMQTVNCSFNKSLFVK